MFSSVDDNEETHLSSYIHGYHIYNAIWSATVGVELRAVVYAREVGKVKDGYAIFIL